MTNIRNVIRHSTFYNDTSRVYEHKALHKSVNSRTKTIITFSILAIAISFLVMASPSAGAVFVSIFLGIAPLIIGIEIIAVGWTGRRMQITSAGGRKINFKI